MDLTRIITEKGTIGIAAEGKDGNRALAITLAKLDEKGISYNLATSEIFPTQESANSYEVPKKIGVIGYSPTYRNRQKSDILAFKIGLMPEIPRFERVEDYKLIEQKDSKFIHQYNSNPKTFHNKKSFEKAHNNKFNKKR